MQILIFMHKSDIVRNMANNQTIRKNKNIIFRKFFFSF